MLFGMLWLLSAVGSSRPNNSVAVLSLP